MLRSRGGSKSLFCKLTVSLKSLHSSLNPSNRGDNYVHIGNESLLERLGAVPGSCRAGLYWMVLTGLRSRDTLRPPCYLIGTQTAGSWQQNKNKI